MTRLIGFECIFTAVLCTFSLSCLAMNMSSVNYYLDEVRSLSELPLDKLIKIKSSFAKKNMYDYDFGVEGRTSSALSMPMAIPLKRISNKPIRRYEEWDDKGKDSKISKIFQLTVTALSFLAFGGYLLTLIITAIRRNQTTATQSSVIVLTSLQRLQNVKRPKRGLVVYDPNDNEWAAENLYRGMLMLSTDYSNQFHR